MEKKPTYEELEQKLRLMEEKEADQNKVDEEKERLTTLVEYNRDFVWLTSLDGIIFYMNRAVRKKLGLPGGKTEGFSVYEYVPAGYEKMVNDKAIPAVIAQGYWQGQGRLKNFKTKTDLPVDISVFLVRSPHSGDPVCLALSMKDITHHEKRDQELRLTGKIDQAFLMFQDDQVYGQVLEIIREANGSPLGLFGYINGEGDLAVPALTPGVRDAGLTSDKDFVFNLQNDDHTIWAQAINNKQSQYSNQPIENVPDGHMPMKRILDIPIMYGDEVIGNFMVANRETDYTDEDVELLEKISDHIAPVLHSRLQSERVDRQRKLAEEALTASEEKFRLAFHTSPDSICISRPETGEYIEINEGFTNITGYTAKEAIGETSLNLNVWTNPQDRADLVQGLQENGIVHNQEAQFTHKNGTKLWGLISASFIELEGQPHILTIIRDITAQKQAEEEQKQLEAQFQQAQKMEAIGTLAGGVAHDFNNLLMGIQGRASLMLIETDPNHPHKEHLKGIEEYVKKASELTRQLLGFARGGKYEVQPVHLNSLISQQTKLFGRTRKEIIIFEKYEENLSTVEADPGQLEQVLLNMYINSWQAMARGGKLYIQTENVILDKEKTSVHKIDPGRFVKISITDTGNGMDEETMSRVFEPFYTTKEMGRGTGLGLASAYGIVANHGGFIEVSSQPGHGSSFYIYLPASNKETKNNIVPDGAISSGTETILLVDDEDISIEVQTMMLESLGHEIMATKTGQEAVRIFEESKDKIDLVILDMVMPGMDGSEVFDLIKKIKPDVKIILCSGYSINGEAAEIMNRGCDGFIQKPFDTRELSQIVREILDG